MITRRRVGTAEQWPSASDKRLQQERLDVAGREVHTLVVYQLLEVLAAAQFKHEVHVRVPAKHVQQLALRARGARERVTGQEE